MEKASKKVIFVCLGNICRSPLAEGVMNKLVAESRLDLEVDSAGTASYHIDENPHFLSIKVAKNHGVDISNYLGRKINVYDDLGADFVLAMDEQNLRDLKNLGFSQARLLGDFGLNGKSVPDPYGKGEEAFEEVYKMIELACSNFLDSIKDSL